MRHHSLIKRVTRSRTLWSLAAVLVVCFGAATSAIVQARVDPGPQESGSALLSQDVVAIVTGGGTVLPSPVSTPQLVASFGINAKRPAGFVSGGAAQGRINYDKHANVPNRHVNVAVDQMEANPTNATTNHTGGQAVLLGSCGALGAECPAGFTFVTVYVEDNSDSCSPSCSDVFQISFCSGTEQLPPATFSGGTPPGCNPVEGGTIRTGNIQVRTSITGASASMATAARAPLRLP
jgi:hypothetical protein